MRIEGDLTINNIRSIKAETDKLISEGKPVNLTIDRITQIDLTFIQLLISLIREGVSLRLEMSKSDKARLQEYITLCGFNDEIDKIIVIK